jgi:hypothetical protein
MYFRELQIILAASKVNDISIWYLFLRGAVKPKSSEVIKRSIGSPVPAKAQAPNGEKFTLSWQFVNLPASRSSYIKEKFCKFFSSAKRK